LRKVLIIEDDCNTRNGLQELLELEGYEVQATSDGASAITRADAVPDIVLVDFRLPDMSGIQVVERLTGGRRPALIILMTAFLTPEICRQASKSGIDACLSKPLDIDELLASMHQSSIMRDKQPIPGWGRAALPAATR
jgi:DNA-binding response OmpR family regulator